MLAPAWAYLTAWGYEYGYSEHFGIPLALITIGLDSVLVLGGLALLWCGATAFVANGIAGAILSIRESAATKLNRFRASFGLILYLIMLAGFFTVSRPVAFITLIVVLIVVASYVFGHPRKADDVSVWLKLVAIYTLPVPIAGRLLLGLGVLSVWSMYMLGGAIARTQEDFLVLTSRPSVVILRAHGGIAICAEVDGHETKRQFRIVQLTNDDATWAVRRIGPLAPLGASDTSKKER